VTTISNAVRAFRNQPVVAAVSQPTIPPGTVDSLLGNLTITETQAGQFKFGETITVTVLPLATPAGTNQVTRFVTGITSALPSIATNTASGLIATAATVAVGGLSFSFQINQQATGTLGVITISNMHVYNLADAPAGNILVRVQSGSPAGAVGVGVAIDQVVSNGRIAAAAAADAWIARGLNVRASSAFGLATAVTKRGSYVTVRARISGAGPGTLVGIWVKTKTTAWHLETSRRVSTDGYMYYSGKVLNLGYRYYRVNALGATSNTVRGYGK
jgi:hypothetical protein